LGIEMKRMDAPTPTASMRVALTDLKLGQLAVIYPGAKSYELAPRVRVIPVGEIATAGINGITPPRRTAPKHAPAASRPPSLYSGK
jgi:hypothetical protein